MHCLSHHELSWLANTNVDTLFTFLIDGSFQDVSINSKDGTSSQWAGLSTLGFLRNTAVHVKSWPGARFFLYVLHVYSYWCMPMILRGGKPSRFYCPVSINFAYFSFAKDKNNNLSQIVHTGHLKSDSVTSDIISRARRLLSRREICSCFHFRGNVVVVHPVSFTSSHELLYQKVWKEDLWRTLIISVVLFAVGLLLFL